MKHSYLYLLIALGAIAIAMASCKVKKLTKQAQQYEAAGMYRQAADSYLSALERKSDKPELSIGLRRTGQLYLDELSAQGRSAFQRNEFRETVYSYLSANDMINKLEGTGIKLRVDPALERCYQDAKNNYLQERYDAGLRLITDQNFKDAKDVFEEIAKIDADYRDTRSYLNEATLEPLYRDGTKLYSEGKYMEAYRKWDLVCKKDAGYKDTKARMEQALSDRYNQGALLLMQENFDQAALALGDVHSVNPNYREVHVQYIEARNEPIYRRANQEMLTGKCRSAYYDFDQIIKDAATYKDASVLRDNALQCATYPVAVYSSSIRNQSGESVRIKNTLIENLLARNNIFLKIYDLSALDAQANERIISKSGQIDNQTMKNLASAKKIKAVLFLDFENYKKDKGDLTSNKMTGFERQTIKKADGTTQIHDQKVKYTSLSQTNSASLKINYRLVSAATGEILLSDAVWNTRTDQTSYATYEGNKSNLYPAKNISGTWVLDDNGHNNLQKLLRNDDKIKSVETLQSELYNELTTDIAMKINNFDPEK
jgi:tetratricopeptide (TPR) repeat protein